ncbi:MULTISPECIES: hypothetical protein [unclassified Anabaena]|uniref:hypothetical protein n=1 Tax=unclassified Anabaena TaxID=2619674 RepID=UPI0039C71967
MAIHLTKWLSVFANILALVIFIPGIALAAPVPINTVPSIIFSPIASVPTVLNSFTEIDLTPQQQQQLQAVRQRRNREIGAVLNSSQRDQLAHSLRAGNDINQALKKLNLQPEQQDLIKAIVQFTNLKMQAISTRHSLQVGAK